MQTGRLYDSFLHIDEIRGFLGCYVRVFYSGDYTSYGFNGGSDILVAAQGDDDFVAVNLRLGAQSPIGGSAGPDQQELIDSTCRGRAFKLSANIVAFISVFCFVLLQH
jgi:hypothetical protein